MSHPENLSEIKTVSKPLIPLVQRSTDPSVLLRILDRSKALGHRGIVAFDLDSTLFDNHPRWVKILREYGQIKKIPALIHCNEQTIHGFSMYISMIQSGVEPGMANMLESEAYAFWAERFYSSPYCLEDKPILGAVSYLEKIQQTGAQIAYVTGRHQAMVDGTAACMKQVGMPVPNQKNVHMLAKPLFETSDDTWKEEAYSHLRALGELIAAFDNEPIHINSYHLAFPSAQAVHLLTNDSGRGVLVLPEIPSIRDFSLPKITV